MTISSTISARRRTRAPAAASALTGCTPTARTTSSARLLGRQHRQNRRQDQGANRVPRRRRRIRGRGAAASTSRIACGSPSMRATRSACSIRSPPKFRSGRCRRPDGSSHSAEAVRNGEAWTGGMSSDRVVRLDPKTGQYDRIPAAAPTNIRRFDIDKLRIRARFGSATPTAHRSSRSSRWIRQCPRLSRWPAQAGIALSIAPTSAPIWARTPLRDRKVFPATAKQAATRLC